MNYRCLSCEEVKECKFPNFLDKIGYVCGLAGENEVDIFEFNGEYMSERVHRVMETGRCEFKETIKKEGLEGII